MEYFSANKWSEYLSACEIFNHGINVQSSSV